MPKLMLFFTTIIVLDKRKRTKRNLRSHQSQNCFRVAFKSLTETSVLDDRLIKKLNEIINRNIRETEGYRSVQVFIRGSEHIPPEPEKVPNLITYFIYNYNHSEEDIFEKMARYHIEFKKIHPFEDGNVGLEGYY